MKLMISFNPVCLFLAFGLGLVGCKPSGETATAPAEVRPGGLDMPILPVKNGDFWKYRVTVSVPAGVTSPDSPAVETSHERIRTYVGKVPMTPDTPPVDCFEVVTPGAPITREFVDIHEDRIDLRGELKMRDENSKPIVFPEPITFIKAGMQAGDDLQIPAMDVGGNGSPRYRTAAIIGREDCVVPAGTFSSIRMVMGELDGGIETRRTIWFSPGSGIIKEERIRYAEKKVVVKELHELVSKG